MNVLVTGSSGQLGSEIAARLRRAGHSVRGLDLAGGPHTTHQGSVTDRDVTYSSVAGSDVVIHTAALHHAHINSHQPAEFIDTNLHGTLNVLQAAVANGVGRLIYTCSTAIYGRAIADPETATWVTEDLAPQPRDIYEIPKWAAEQLCREYAEDDRLKVVSIRVSRFFPESPMKLAINRLYRGVDVGDAAEAHILALGVPMDGFEVFNISARSPFSRDDLKQLRRDAKATILRYFPSAEAVFSARGWMLPSTIDRVYVTDRAARILAYQPMSNFEEYVLSTERADHLG